MWRRNLATFHGLNLVGCSHPEKPTSNKRHQTASSSRLSGADLSTSLRSARMAALEIAAGQRGAGVNVGSGPTPSPTPPLDLREFLVGPLPQTDIFT